MCPSLAGVVEEVNQDGQDGGGNDQRDRTNTPRPSATESEVMDETLRC